MKKLLIASLLVLGGCASPQVVNYTLTPIADPLLNAKNLNLLSASQIVPYKLDRVTVPAQSDDLSLVVRDGGDRLMVLTYDRWTVSLSDEVTEALATALTDELGMPPAQAWSSVAVNLPHNEIQVDVRRFEMLPGQSANLSASWYLKFSQGLKGDAKQASKATQQSVSSTATHTNNATSTTSRAVSELTCFANFSHTAQPGVLPLVQAQQLNIRQLSQKIAETLQARQAVDGVVCR
jgi:uncharacterized lipoprotein YmbA